jgi:hypothetical protein
VYPLYFEIFDFLNIFSVIVRAILAIRTNLSEGRPSLLAFSKQFGKLQLDFSIQLGMPGQDEERGDRQGLHRRVSRMVLLGIRQDNYSYKNTQVKKSGGNPFIENLSRLEGKGAKIGPTLANLASMRRIL